MKRRLKVIAGILLTAMAMGEMTTGFFAYPVIMMWSDTRIEWWASYLPIVMLLNSLIASTLCAYLGIKLLNEGSIFTEKQTQWVDGKINRWLERRKYGYHRSDFIIKQEG